MKRKLIVFLIIPLIWLSACVPIYTGSSAEQTAIARGKTLGAPDAVSAYLTQQALMTPSATPLVSPTPTDRGFRLPFPSLPPFQIPGTRVPRSEVTPTPMFILYSVKVRHDQIPYFDNRTDIEEYEKGKSATTEGNLGSPMILNVLEQWKGGDNLLQMLKILAQGRMLMEDLGMSNLEPEDVVEGMTGKTTCESHREGHVNDDSLVHCHFLVNTGGSFVDAKIVGTVESGVEYVVLSSDLDGRFVKVRLLDPYWVRVSDVEMGN